MRQSTQHTEPEPLLSKRALFEIHKGELKRADAPALYEHLLDESAPCLLLEGGDREPPWELEVEESDEILRRVLEAVGSKGELSEERRPSGFWSKLRKVWKSPVVWAPITALGAIFFFVSQVSWFPKRYCDEAGLKCGGRVAAYFYQLKVFHKHNTAGPKTEFQQMGSYHPGDGLLFRLITTKPGYLILLREDTRGRLEQVYPFTKGAHTPLQAGTHELLHHGERQIFEFEKKYIGKQIIYLVLAEKMEHFPLHKNALSFSQKELLKRSDFLSFFVRSPR